MLPTVFVHTFEIICVTVVMFSVNAVSHHSEVIWMVSAMEALANLINQMDEHCNPLPVAVTFNPQPGEMCCAKYQGKTGCFFTIVTPN